MSAKVAIMLRLIVVSGLLLGLYLLEGRGMAWLISVLNGLAGLSGLLFFIAFCGCLFVDEAKRHSRMGLAMFGLGSFGFLASVTEWLQSDAAMDCES